MTRYRSIPQDVDAFQYDGTDAGFWRLEQWLAQFGGASLSRSTDTLGPAHIRTELLDGEIEPGDWIIRNANGVVFMANDEAFRERYALLDDQAQPQGRTFDLDTLARVAILARPIRATVNVYVGAIMTATNGTLNPRMVSEAVYRARETTDPLKGNPMSKNFDLDTIGYLANIAVLASPTRLAPGAYCAMIAKATGGALEPTDSLDAVERALAAADKAETLDPAGGSNENPLGD